VPLALSPMTLIFWSLSGRARCSTVFAGRKKLDEPAFAAVGEEPTEIQQSAVAVSVIKAASMVVLSVTKLVVNERFWTFEKSPTAAG
jgi:hypothetical protein